MNVAEKYEVPAVSRRLDGIPEGLDRLEEIDLTVKWQLSHAEIERMPQSLTEINELFLRRLAGVMKERGATHAFIIEEKLTRRHVYDGSQTVLGDYKIALYGK